MNQHLRVGVAGAVAIVLFALGIWYFDQQNRILVPAWTAMANDGPHDASGEPPAAGDGVRVPPASSLAGMIKLETASATPLPLTDTLAARVAYDDDATVRVSAGFNGRITRLIASPGDRVQVGSPLAEIDSPDYGLAAADLAKARADEEHKRLTLDRSRDLLSGGVVPLKDVESAQADYLSARAETTRAAQRVRNLNPSGKVMGNGHFVLTSPMAGIVTERTANPSMEISPAVVAPLFIVSDLRHLWILIDLPERLLGKVVDGAQVVIESDAYPGRRFDATIVHVAQVLDAATRRVAVRARVDNADLRLRPEMFVRATVVSDQGRGVRVPNEALVNEGLYTYVYLQSEAGTYRRVRVEPVVKGAEYSYIGDGLAAGDRIVVAGALLLAAEQATAGGS